MLLGQVVELEDVDHRVSLVLRLRWLVVVAVPVVVGLLTARCGKRSGVLVELVGLEFGQRHAHAPEDVAGVHQAVRLGVEPHVPWGHTVDPYLHLLTLGQRGVRGQVDLEVVAD